METPLPRPQTGPQRAPVVVLSALVALSLLVILLALSWRALDGLFDEMRGSTEISRLPAPGGRHDAVLFEHNCGATTDFARHVSVLPVGASLGDTPGNACAAEAGENRACAPWGWSTDEGSLAGEWRAGDSSRPGSGCAARG